MRFWGAVRYADKTHNVLTLDDDLITDWAEARAVIKGETIFKGGLAFLVSVPGCGKNLKQTEKEAAA